MTQIAMRKKILSPHEKDLRMTEFIIPLQADVLAIDI